MMADPYLLPTPHASQQTPIHDQVGRGTAFLAALGVVTIVVVLRALAEYTMMAAHGSDAQMGIWYMFAMVKVGICFVIGLIVAGLLSAVWPRRLASIAVALLLLVWAGWVGIAALGYYSGGRALYAASYPATSTERLDQLIHFKGIQAGYELDNRIAAHSNSSVDGLRQLYERDNLGTKMVLARNPNTPPDILEKLSNSSEKWIKQALLYNPNLAKDARDRLSTAEPNNSPDKLTSTPERQLHPPYHQHPPISFP